MLQWRLKELVDVRRLRLKEVARLSGVSYETVRAMYHNAPRHFRLSTLEKLAQALDVPCEALYRPRMKELHLQRNSPYL